ncbi:hypothetical protein GE061_015835 [Apolygus lucorum]|uniref:CCHC-type domain-containing protein n=1 Tax=Apolygus lucorum TaxID=248454 RepID=A0A8S9XNA7_APOLU|nr:hypothetical protein GE061_015835 [Apolygus lucorum]
MRDMLLEEQLRNSQMEAGSSLSLFRSRIATSRGRGKFSTGRKGEIPGQSSNSNIRGTSASSKPSTKKMFGKFCKRRGHTSDTCCRANKLCFICKKSATHVAANCPDRHLTQDVTTPQKKPARTQPRSVPSQLKARSTNGRPKVFSMPFGQAKKLAREFKTHPDAMFSITAPQNSSPQQQVWVTMGDEEEQHLTTLNYMSEQRGDGTIFQITEGEHESWA